MDGETDNELIKFIATTVETMRDQMVTKQELAALEDKIATKRDVAELRDEMATLRDQMATKEEVAALRDQMGQMVTKQELKKEIALLKEQMATKIDVAAIRGDVEQVQLRLDSIDRALGARLGLVETEISRLRSVLYLLVRDKPDMLRLLGNPLPESRPQV